MSLPDGRKVALVLSGGGANGAYEVGVLKALIHGLCPTTDYQPLEPDIFVGTSIGGLNAAFLVAQWDQYGPAAVTNLERFWLDVLAGNVRNNGVFRLRGNPLELLDLASYKRSLLQPLSQLFEDTAYLSWQGLQRLVQFSTGRPRPIERRVAGLLDLTAFIAMEPLAESLRQIDYGAIRRSSRFLKVAATNWATGQLRIFWNHDMTDAFGPVAIRASAAVPGLFPPAEYGSQPYVDGSVLMNTPLSPAIHAGAEVLHVLYIDPDVANIPLDRLQHIYSTMHRLFQIGWAADYNDDIADAARINRSLAVIERARREGGMDERGIEWLEEAAQLSRRPGQEPFRPLTIHRYHPQDPLEGELSLLNFDRDRVEELIQRGFDDAVGHQPKRSADVPPDGQTGHWPTRSRREPGKF